MIAPTTAFRLTDLCSGGGCASKVGAADLARALARVPRGDAHPNVLVGYGDADDAGVYRLSDELALVQTVDFFPPIVDDPYEFGRIAATNALSDVYAMGGTPITALSIVAYDIEAYGDDVLVEILRGGTEVARAAGVAILGGHTVKDAEPKYGLAVTGTIRPGRIVANGGARVGDVLVLTKALGTGVLANAAKRDLIDRSGLAPAIASMTTSNARASREMLGAGVHAATDVTGFGLLGHARETARASGVRLRLVADAVPLLPGVLALIADGVVPGGSKRNAGEHAAFTTFAEGIAPALRLALSDAQTSGGLLAAFAPEDGERFAAAMIAAGAPAAIIGSVESGTGEILVV